jgi:hypothetical protein
LRKSGQTRFFESLPGGNRPCAALALSQRV